MSCYSHWSNNELLSHSSNSLLLFFLLKQCSHSVRNTSFLSRDFFLFEVVSHYIANMLWYWWIHDDKKCFTWLSFVSLSLSFSCARVFLLLLSCALLTFVISTRTHSLFSISDLLERQDTFWLEPMRKKRKKKRNDDNDDEEENRLSSYSTRSEASRQYTKWKTLFLHFHTDDHWQWLDERKKWRVHARVCLFDMICGRQPLLILKFKYKRETERKKKKALK